jgi:hypothetical protein
MNIVKAYQSTKGNVFKKKSEALNEDARIVFRDMATKIEPHYSEEYVLSTFKVALEKKISPRRLMRMYQKLWNMRKAYELVLAEEATEQELPF